MDKYNVKLQLELEHWTGLWHYEVDKLKADPENGYKLLVSARYELMRHPVGTSLAIKSNIFMSVDAEPVELHTNISGPIPKAKGLYEFTVVKQGTGLVESMKQDQVECDCESCCPEPIDLEEKPVIQKSGYEFL